SRSSRSPCLSTYTNEARSMTSASPGRVPSTWTSSGIQGPRSDPSSRRTVRPFSSASLWTRSMAARFASAVPQRRSRKSAPLASLLAHRHDISCRLRPIVPPTLRPAVHSDERHPVALPLRDFGPSPLDPELLHPAPQRVGMKVEDPRRALRPTDHPSGLPQDREDVASLDVLQRAGRRDRRRGRRGTRPSADPRELAVQLE